MVFLHSFSQAAGCPAAVTLVSSSVSVRKWWLSPEFEAGGEFEPEEYTEYFEDSNSPLNMEIG
jgi:hypothetical protein